MRMLPLESYQWKGHTQLPAVSTQAFPRTSVQMSVWSKSPCKIWQLLVLAYLKSLTNWKCFIKCCPMMTFSRSWPNITSLCKTTDQPSWRMMRSLLQAISSQCQRVIHFKLNSMPLEREQHCRHCFSWTECWNNIVTWNYYENFNRDLIERNWEYM